MPEMPKRKNDDTQWPRRFLFLICVLIISIGSIAVLWWQGSRPVNDLPTARLIYWQGKDRNMQSLNLQTGARAEIKIEFDQDQVPSPDGRWYAWWNNINTCCDSSLKLLSREDQSLDTGLGIYSGSSHSISWSSDSQWIAFSAEPRASGYYGNQRSLEEDGWPTMYEEIYLVKITPYELERLTENNVVDHYPSISPDGTQIVYTSEVDGQGHLYMMDRATRETRLLTPSQDGYHAVWSPDGQWIAFMSNYQNGGYDAPSYGDLWLIRADGTQAQSLVSNVSFSEPLWLP